MYNELKQLIEVANGLLKTADVGKEYTMEYIVSRLVAALDECPHDPVLHSMAQVIHKQAMKGKLIISQKELYEVYNHFSGFSSNSSAKEIIGDLLYKVAIPELVVGNSTEVAFRENEKPLDIVIEDNPLSNLFDKDATTSSYYDPTLAKLAKGALIEELNVLGIVPTDIKVFGGNDYAIIYDAIFTNKLGTAHVAIPVEISNGITAPIYFYNQGQYVDLTTDNLNKYIVEKSIENKSNVDVFGGLKTSSSVISPSFTFEEDAQKPIELDKVELPESLKNIAHFENMALDSSTHFSVEVVKAAKALCMRELNTFGLSAQIALVEATDNCIICRAELDSSAGKAEIRLPVEVVDGKPQIPSLFYNNAEKERIYDLNKEEISNYLTSAKHENGRIMRYSNDFFNMTYNQLKEEIVYGVANKDYIRAEQALNRIEDKFGYEQHRATMADYANMLTHTSKITDTPKNKCRLILTRGSIEPRCGHYNVPMNRVITDEKGNCELIERKAKYDNLHESTGTMIRANKIILT